MSLVKAGLKILNKEVACHASVVKLLNADLEESRMESLFSEHSFEKTKVQVLFLYLDLILEDISLFKIIQDKKLVKEVGEEAN